MFRVGGFVTVGMVAVLVFGSIGGCSSFGYYDHRPVRQSHVYVEPQPVHVTRIAADHVCDERCYDHVYNGSRVIVLRGHRHGPGCGHRWNGRYWVIAKAASHRRSNDAHRVAPHPVKRRARGHFRGERPRRLRDHD